MTTSASVAGLQQNDSAERLLVTGSSWWPGAASDGFAAGLMARVLAGSPVVECTVGGVDEASEAGIG